MWQFHKGRRLLRVCTQRTRVVYMAMTSAISEKQQLMRWIEQVDEQLTSLLKSLDAQQLNNVEVTKAEIDTQRRQQVILLDMFQQLNIERQIHLEQLATMDKAIRQHQMELARLKRREMKLTQWTQRVRREWLLKQEAITETEQQDDVPWRSSWQH